MLGLDRLLLGGSSMYIVWNIDFEVASKLWGISCHVSKSLVKFLRIVFCVETFINNSIKVKYK